MNKICVILPFYGSWPSYFNLYLNTCGYNSFIDFIFFTDITPPLNHPKNVYFNRLTFDEFRNLIDMKLNIISKIANPYKICDIRPAFGLLFQDYIKMYEYWGHGDVDVIYGNIKNFMEYETIRQYDIVSFRTEWISGALAFFKNSEYVNHLFLKHNDYKIVFQDSKHYSFGECGKVWDLARAKSILLIPQKITNMTRIVKEEELSGKIKTYFNTVIKESINENEYLTYDKGMIKSSSETEFLLYHFIYEKKKWWFKNPTWRKMPSRCYINQYGFFNCNEFKKGVYFLIVIQRKTIGFLKYLMKIPKKFLKKCL